MASTKTTTRQKSFESFSSPLSAVFNSVGVQQNEKAVKHAFYNTAALVFVALSACAAVAVYYVLEAFLRPLLWAALCGAFLYPFKWKLTEVVRGFLRSLRESKTPLVVGAFLVPFQVANKSSDLVGSFVIRKIRIFVFFGLSAAGLFGLYVIQPFDEILWMLKGTGDVVHLLLDAFHNPYPVWSVVIGYVVILAFFWTASSSPIISFFSFPVWCILLLHLVSLTGPYRIVFFVLLVVCSIVGCFTGITEEQDQVDGRDDWTSKRRSLIRGLSVAAAALGTTISSPESNDSSDDNRRESVPSRHASDPATAESADSKDGIDTVEGQPFVKFERTKAKQSKQKPKLKKEGHSGSKSNIYFVALFWAILLTRLWFHWKRMLLLLIPFVFYMLKQAVALWSESTYSGSFFVSLNSWWSVLKQWAEERRHVLIPAPLGGLFKGAIKVDRLINSIMDRTMSNIISIFMVLFLIVAFTLITVFLAVQVHHESSQLVSVSANLVNRVMANNPQLVNWIQENTELKKTVEASVERAYVYGRKFIAAKIQSLFDDHHQNSTELQEQVLDLTDRIYHSWIARGNASSSGEMSKNGTITAVKPESNATAGISWKNVMNVFNVFDVRVSFSLIRENLGTLLSLLESVWIFLKGNISFAFNLVTSVLSVVFISGAYVLNTGLSMIVFVTALFYLLSASGEQYKPVEWFGKLTASGTSGFGDSAYGAIRGVFGAAVKMATFYGIYTWFTHTTFGVNIVYIPSALAAITAVVPFVGTYFAAVPAVLELWLVQGRGILAIVLAICHFLPTYFVDVAIYSEISGGSHPYLTGLAVAGGIYCVGLEGAIIGPIVLCCLLVACNVYSSMIGEGISELSDSTITANSSQANREETQYRSVISDQVVKDKVQ